VGTPHPHLIRQEGEEGNIIYTGNLIDMILRRENGQEVPSEVLDYAWATSKVLEVSNEEKRKVVWDRGVSVSRGGWVGGPVCQLLAWRLKKRHALRRKSRPEDLMAVHLLHELGVTTASETSVVPNPVDGIDQGTTIRWSREKGGSS